MVSGVEFKPTETDRKTIEEMAGWGVPYASMAALVCGGMDKDTFAKHFRKELDRGKANAQAKVGQTLFQRACSGEDTTATIWYTKTQMGFKDTSRIEHTDGEGNPLQGGMVTIVNQLDGKSSDLPKIEE